MNGTKGELTDGWIDGFPWMDDFKSPGAGAKLKAET